MSEVGKAEGKIFELNCENQVENFTLDRNCVKPNISVNYTKLMSQVSEIPTGLVACIIFGQHLRSYSTPLCFRNTNQVENFTLDRNCVKPNISVNYTKLISQVSEIPTGLVACIILGQHLRSY
jgi:hypothetical protein